MIQKADDPDKKKVESLGKTNKLLFELKYDKKMFLHPFVFGIPFSKNGIFIINSNGHYLNLSNSGKIFYTAIKVSHISIMYTGILKQGKLQIPSEVDEASKVILFAELMIKCMVAYCNQVNVYNGVCCIRTLEEGNILIEPLGDKPEEKPIETMTDEKSEKVKPKIGKGIAISAYEILESDEKV